TETDAVWERLTQGMRVNLNIRPIDFFGRSTHVNHQINDGPCALIAVCNVLLLKEDIFFEPHETVVSMEYLLNLVVSFLKEKDLVENVPCILYWNNH
uniref:MINDY deubiquitinase domain-containing protein n=1 Tax=Setaria italica TaxID=4555 RepID=K4A0X5_SETIT